MSVTNKSLETVLRYAGALGDFEEEKLTIEAAVLREVANEVGSANTEAKDVIERMIKERESA